VRPAALEVAARRLALPIHVTESGLDLRLQARRAVEEGLERLIVAGGDGSMHIVVQELAGSGTALAPIAAGRGNDFATCAGVPRDLEPALEMATGGPIRAVDYGRADDVAFVVHCGVGFDSEAARWANEQQIARGILSYPLSVLRTLFRFEPPRIRVEYEGGVFEDEAMFVVCANCWRFGGGMKIAPEATIDDGLLDVIVARRVSRATILALLPRVYSGRHTSHPAVTIVRTPWARISLDRPMQMYGDGEAMLWIDEAPLQVRVEPASLRVVATSSVD
jgi:diacylglycerol kinase (ATP)